MDHSVVKSAIHNTPLSYRILVVMETSATVSLTLLRPMFPIDNSFHMVLLHLPLRLRLRLRLHRPHRCYPCLRVSMEPGVASWMIRVTVHRRHIRVATALPVILFCILAHPTSATVGSSLTRPPHQHHPHMGPPRDHTRTRPRSCSYPPVNMADSAEILGISGILPQCRIRAVAEATV